MKSRTVRIVLDVTIADLSHYERREAADDGDCTVDELPDVGDVSISEFAELASDYLAMDNEELFAGSMMFCKIAGSKVISAHEQK